jgi:hypothetical protein
VDRGNSPTENRRGGQVRTQEERNKVKDNHFLENAEGRGSGLEDKARQGTHCLESTYKRTNEKMQTKQALGEGYSLPREHTGRDMSEYEQEASEQHSLSREHGGRDKSGHEKNASDGGTHFLKSTKRGRTQDTERKEENERGALTSWGCTKGGTSHETKGKQANQGHSHAREGKGRNKLEYEIQRSKRWAEHSLPRERRDRGGGDKSKQWMEVSRQGSTYLLEIATGPPVRIYDGFKWARATHILESIERG